LQQTNGDDLKHAYTGSNKRPTALTTSCQRLHITDLLMDM